MQADRSTVRRYVLGASVKKALKTPLKKSVRGFTLLEIMLVLLLMGLATSMVVTSIMPADSGAELKKMAGRFAAQLQAAHEEAILEGRDFGVVVMPDYYEFVMYRDGKWQPVKGRRLLGRTSVAEEVQLTVYPGESIWRSSLESALEQEQGNSDSDFAYTFTSSEEDQQKTVPDLYIWSSAEVSPAEIRFQSRNNRRESESVLLEEMGRIYLKPRDAS